MRASSGAPRWWASSPTRPAWSVWPGSILLEVHDEWQISDRRYLSEASMAKLYETDNDGRDTKEVGAKTNELLAG